MVSNQEDSTTSIEEKLISPKQLHNFYRKRDESFYNKEVQRVAYRNLAIPFSVRLPANVVKTKLNKSFRRHSLMIPGSLYFSVFLSYILPPFSNDSWPALLRGVPRS